MLSKNNPQRNIAFLVPAGFWNGGKNYMKNLFLAMRTIPGTPYLPIVFTGTDNAISPTDYAGVTVVQTPLLTRKSIPWIVRKAISVALGKDILLGRLLRRHSVVALSHIMQANATVGLPTLAWIPDFQHVHLPQFFDEEERAFRDRNLKGLCASDKIIVSSLSAQKDLEAFDSSSIGRIECLRFVASPISGVNSPSSAEIAERYGFAGPFFLLPNQFWEHKNHQVVVDALAILRKRGERILVLATGPTHDDRRPQFFDSLMAHVAEQNVTEQFRVLGQIPFDDLLGLMRDCVALLNPSKFEGWSTSVEESKSMGKHVILSDIPVHQEQAPKLGHYFAVNDAESLANVMQAVLQSFSAEQDRAMRQRAHEEFPERQKHFAKQYAEILDRALI
ncbi:glycosyltransferase [Terriglobus sp. TAA 43]|uniref:glycosyltransferase n=1 Tax=Terriglobus sp. TAA 43 TaxID=278961 RepID=UPI000648D77C|nr:glycosyltransferase [Terriglobus sp. TAA 43]